MLLFLLPGVLGVNVVAGGHEKGAGTFPSARDSAVFEHMPTAKAVLSVSKSAKSIQMTVQTLQLRFTFHRHRRAMAPCLSQRSAAAPLCSTSVHALTFRQLSHFPIFPPCSRHQHPVDNAGLFSFMTLHWLSPLALKAFRASRLSVDDVWGLSCHEASETNCQR